MREIKFRAWDKSRNEMLEVYEIWFTFATNRQRKTLSEPSYSTSTGNHSFESDCLMQYTGLNDKNGKEIYEGDILHNAGSVAVVSFKDGAFGVGEFRFPLDKFAGKNKEVIGNIYENPDLVK